ncbi:MAG: putative lipid II flippase FtsW [bacterium]
MSLKVDWDLFVVMLLLTVTGLVMIYSSSAVSAYELVGQTQYFFLRQLIWSLLGLGTCFVACYVSFETIRTLSPAFYLGVLALLGVVLVPALGREASGAWRWIDLGVVGIQPSAPAKLSIILMCAYYLTAVDLKPNLRVKHLVVVLSLTFLYCFLIALQPDLGTAIQIGLITLIMLFLAGFPVSHLITIGILSIPVGAITIFSSGYRTERVVAYLNPWSDPYDKGYHIIQSFNALAAGGLTGRGIGESVRKKGYLPEPYTDSIVAVMGEELGLIGITVLIGLLVYLTYKGFSVSLRATDTFQQLVGLGISSFIGLQALLNLSVVTGLIPTTGISMPFISYGGSALLVNMTAVGLLLNISRGRHKNV